MNAYLRYRAEVEQGFVGGLLSVTEKERLRSAAAIVLPRDFHHKLWRRIYEAWRKRWFSRKPISPAGLWEDLKWYGELHRHGGEDLLHELSSNPFYAATLEYNICRIVAVDDRRLEAAVRSWEKNAPDILEVAEQIARWLHENP